MTDPIADMLTRIRNANTAKHDTVDVPSSKMKLAIAKILLDEGYIKAYELVKPCNDFIFFKSFGLETMTSLPSILMSISAGNTLSSVPLGPFTVTLLLSQQTRVLSQIRKLESSA